MGQRREGMVVICHGCAGRRFNNQLVYALWLYERQQARLPLRDGQQGELSDIRGVSEQNETGI